MIPNNVRTVRLTAAAGTNLARASSRDRSSFLFSLSTVLYNPKAFIAHAASLGQACAHCRRSSTAATRRCLASVSVPVARVVLSHPLDIFALVSRYLTNKLIGRGPIRKRLAPLVSRPHEVLIQVSLGYPPLPGMYPRVTHPFATRPSLYCYINDPVRLACLIHAASVRSEPESNSPKQRYILST